MVGLLLLAVALQGWACLGGEWWKEGGAIVGSSAGQAFAWPEGAPSALGLKFEAVVKVRRILGDGWKLCGICVYLNRGNFWRLALVEGPKGTRYVELVEMFGGRWQAQQSGGTRLEGWHEGSLKWEPGRPYGMRLLLSRAGIRGEVFDPQTGKVLEAIGYRFEGREAVVRGRPALSVSGMEAEFRGVKWEVTAVPGRGARPPKAGLLYEREAAGPGAAKPDRLEGLLKEAGFEVERLDFNALLERGALDEFSLLALPYGPAFPAKARGEILGFLQRGGSFISFGGIPFSRPMWRAFGRWLTYEEAQREVERRARGSVKVFLDFERGDASGWERSTGNKGARSKVELSSPGANGTRRCLHISIRDYRNWDTFYSPPLGRSPFPEGHTLTCFWAKGDGRTPELAVEWVERDGSRWIAVVPLSTEWKFYALPPSAFKYWHDSPTKERRGFPGDRFNPQNARRINFGLAMTHTKRVPPGDHEIWVDEVGTAPSPFDEEPVRPLELFIGREAYPWDFVEARKLAAFPGQEFVKPFEFEPEGSIKGPAAIVLSRRESQRFVPLVLGLDRWGRPQGPLGGLVLNFGGVYEGGIWLLFTAEDADLTDVPKVATGVRRVAELVRHGAFIADGGPEVLSAVKGESVGLFALLYSPVKRRVRVEFCVKRLGRALMREGREVEVCGLKRIEAKFSPQVAGELRVEVTMRERGRVLDRLVWPLYVEPGREERLGGALIVKGGHFYEPTGRRWFCVGSNYEGWFDRCWRMWEEGMFDPRLLEADIRKAAEFGINCMRIFVQRPLADDILRGDFRKLDKVLALGRKYGVRFLLTFTDYGTRDVEEVLEVERRVASRYAEEPAIMGYDLRNEPNIAGIDTWLYPERPAVRDPSLFERLKGLVPEESIEAELERLPRDIPREEGLSLLAIRRLWFKVLGKFGNWTTFPDFPGRWELPPELRPVLEAVDKTFDLWIRLQVEAIREFDKTHPITVGYNSPHALLPCNRRLEFISHHVYEWPKTFESLRNDLTAMSRLHRFWPGKPITLGEFGFSNGIPLDSGHLDPYSSAVGEALVYLYAIAHGFDGCKKWMLNDFPVIERGDRANVYEARFGIFAYDGTLYGRPKPIAHALKWIRRYIEGHGVSARELEFGPDPGSPIPVKFVFRGEGAMAVGGRSFEGVGLRFESERPVVVMVAWGRKGIRLVSTADVEVRLRTGIFVPGMSAEAARGKVRGRLGGAPRAEGPWLVLSLLEGEEVVVGRGGAG